MTVKAEHLLDKSDWLDGPWRAEYDRYEWVDEGTRLPCLVIRHPDMGNLCGYVGVPPDHAAWGYDYDGLARDQAADKRRRWAKAMELVSDLRDKGLNTEEAWTTAQRQALTYNDVNPDEVGMRIRDIRVHGGLTYGRLDDDQGEDAARIGWDPPGWWFYGFDAGHAGDATGFSAPIASAMRGLMYGEYRDAAYMMDQCRRLASQLIKIDC